MDETGGKTEKNFLVFLHYCRLDLLSPSLSYSLGHEGTHRLTSPSPDKERANDIHMTAAGLRQPNEMFPKSDIGQ